MSIAPDEFRQQYKPRFGRCNPEPVHVPFWDQQIRTGDNAWLGRKNVLDDTYADEEPVWTFDRFGSTSTRLTDGRVVRIAGEHEDYYDPDFWIYNDVTVFNPDGTWQIYLYPRDIFPPTDFHATVWIGPYLYTLGNAGSGEDACRAWVYRLDTRDWTFARFDTENSPPRTMCHCFASAVGGESGIRVIGGAWYLPEKRGQQPNDREWLLDLFTRTWRQGDVVEFPAPTPQCPPDHARLEPVRTFEDAYRLVDTVRRTIGHDHPLFGLDLWPLYKEVGQALFRVNDGSGRHVLADLGWGECRSQVGPIAHHFIPGGEDGLSLHLADAGSYDAQGYLRLARDDRTG